MSGGSLVLFLTLENSIKLSKWKVKEGTIVSAGRVLLLYTVHGDSSRPELLKLKASVVGTVRKLLVKEGDVIHPGDSLLELERCTHPTVMKEMCAECGADLRNENATGNELAASIPMVHSIPELKVSAEQAQILGKADEERLLGCQKLVLLVDLDQTLIHTTNDNIPANLKDVYHFRLHGSLSPWHHTRLRPGTKSFLKTMSEFYELHICTFGSRMYAHVIARYLDPDGLYFSHRILSRDECFSANSKTANLKALFPCGDNMVCIIDDREDVWNFAPNLIHVKPYHFFQHTGDINAPPGLAKQENDDKGDYDFSFLGSGQKGLLNAGKNGKTPLPSPSMTHTSECKENSTIPDKEIEDIDFAQTKVIERDMDTNNSFEEGESTVKLLSNETSVSTNSSCNTLSSGLEDTLKVSVPVENSEDCSVSFGKVLKEQNKPSTEEPADPEREVKEPKKLEFEDECKDTPDAITSELLGSEDTINTNKPECLVDPLTETSSTCKALENFVKGSEVESQKTCHQSDIEDEKHDPITSVSSGEDITEDKEPGKEGKTEEIEVQDNDDYLLYLEDILKRIHCEFYERVKNGEHPDLKVVVPAVRKKVLAGTSLVFSGLVPNNIPLERSRAYQVAVSLGAKVTQDLQKDTTHLVAVRPRTAKVNSARHMRGLYMVTADWLWTCAERWEHVDEKVFPLGRNRAGTRHPPAHCGSPEHTPTKENQPEPTSSTGRSRTASGRFMDTINPLLSFSSADIADMDQEVNDIFNESESDGEGDFDETQKRKVIAEAEVETVSEEDSHCRALKSALKHNLDDSDSSSSSADSLSGEHPHGWRNQDRKRKQPIHALGTGTATESDGGEETDDMPSTKFRRGEGLPSDLDLGDNESESEGSQEPPDEMDDGDWNMMGAALEREFLS